MIHLRYSTDPIGVVFRRNGDVPAELWHAVARERDSAFINSADEILIPVDRFLSRRFWLAELLRAYDCGADYDLNVEQLLDRQNDEEDEVSRLLAPGRHDPDEGVQPIVLVGNRFNAEDLRPFQRRDLAHLLQLSHGANFSVPGAGKTAVAYGCYSASLHRGMVERLLVIAPISAFDSWIDEAERWLDPAPVVRILDERIPYGCEVLIVNYDRLDARYAEIAAWVTERPCHIILDEAHRIKRGQTGEWGANCLRLAHLAARRDILTGTPAPNQPADLLALLDFLWPNQAARILPREIRQREPSAVLMNDISRRLQPFFARTNKAELELDEPKLRVEYVQMAPLQARIYDVLRARVRNAILQTGRERRHFSGMSDSVMYLLQAATNPALLAEALGGAFRPNMSWPPQPVPPQSDLVDQTINYASHETPAKFAKLATVVGENAQQGRKTLVWSNFVGNLRELKQRVLAPYSPALIYGGITGDARADELRRFRSDSGCLVLVANPAAMSEGVSLHHECHDAIYLDRSFNAGQYLQSLDRIHRLGLAPGTETRITFLVTERTIDEVVDLRIRQKASRLAQMLSDEHLVLMSLPNIEDYGEWVEPGDLDVLFGHLNVPLET